MNYPVGWARGLLAALGGMAPARRARLIARMPPPALRALAEEWAWGAHPGQEEPPPLADGADWRTWLLMAGRGFGKTRTGAEWVWRQARETPGARIALVGATLDEVAKVMVEGESGLLACAWTGEAPRWWPSRGVLRLTGGAEAFAYGAERPGALRGPQHHFAWCDELAKWKGGETWQNLRMGLRLGDRPRAIVTTTPRAGSLVARIRSRPDTVTTNGRTIDNPHLPDDFVTAMLGEYDGTRIGRQELDGVLFEDVAGTLFARDLLERARVLRDASSPGSAAPQDERSGYQRVVVGVDPPVSADGDACGIVVCGLGRDGAAYVLADCSVAGLAPDGWARAVCGAAAAWGADAVIAETNQGGDMVSHVLRSVDLALPVKPVHASRGKAARAEPVSSWMAAGRVRLAGAFPLLEDELAGLTAGGYLGPGSPDRADAMVWAVSALIKPERVPRVVRF